MGGTVTQDQAADITAAERKQVRVWNVMRNLVRELRRELEKELEPSGLKLIEFQILAHLKKNGPSTMANIAKELTLTRAGIPFLVGGIESRGFVRKRRMQDEGRVVFVYLTPLGGRVLSRALVNEDELVMRKMRKLSPAQLSRLESLLGMLLSPAAEGEGQTD